MTPDGSDAMLASKNECETSSGPLATKVDDRIVSAITAGELETNTISYHAIRGLAGNEHKVWNELDRGRGVLTSTAQLDQYLFSYGPMIRGQWNAILPRTRLPSKGLEIIDYACGQGLATALVLDAMDRASREEVAKVTLVEPSGVALARAQAIVGCYCPAAKIVTINKKLDELAVGELAMDDSKAKVHLFSNILDIDDFNQFELFSKILVNANHQMNRGRHCVLAVSPDRSFKGGSGRMLSLHDSIMDEELEKWVTVKRSGLDRVEIRKGRQSIFLFAEIEV